jgi:hypothetical protein
MSVSEILEELYTRMYSNLQFESFGSLFRPPICQDVK